MKLGKGIVKTKRFGWLALALYLVYVAFYFLQFPHVVHPSFTSYIYLFTPAIAVISGIRTVGIFQLKSAPGQVIGLLALGLFLWLIGEVLFFIFQFIAHTNPFPSAADIFYILAYPILLLGLIKEIKIYGVKLQIENKLLVLLGSLLIITLAIIIGYFDILKAYDSSAPLLNNLIAMGYGVGDFILIIPTFYILRLVMDLKGGQLFYPWMMIMFALFFIMAGDVLFALFNTQYKQYIPAYTLIDLTFIAGYLLFAYSFYFIGSTVEQIPDSKLKVKPK